MVWWLRKHRPDKRKVQIGPICIRFLYKTVSTGIFLLSGRCFLVNSLRQKNKRPAPMCACVNAIWCKTHLDSSLIKCFICFYLLGSEHIPPSAHRSLPLLSLLPPSSLLSLAFALLDTHGLQHQKTTANFGVLRRFYMFIYTLAGMCN